MGVNRLPFRRGLRIASGVIALAVACSLFLITRLRALPPAGSNGVIVIRELKHGVSPPLRTLAAHPPVAWAQSGDDDEEEGPESVGASSFMPDPARQFKPGPVLVTTPVANILGLGYGFTGPSGSRMTSGVPPDPNSAVGNNELVETVNLSLAVFQKTDSGEQPILGPIFIGSLWENFSTACSNGASMADPVVLYDKQAARWVIKIGTLATPYTACIAVSQTSDATGAYFLYAYQFQAEGTQTGQKMGTWPDGYYLATRIVNNNVFSGPSACAMDRSQMLIGQPATMQCVQLMNSKLQDLVPSNMDGPTPPPTGSPNYFLMEGLNQLSLYLYHVDFSNPANTRLAGPVKISVATFTESGSVPQFGTAETLNTNGDSIRPPAQYRYFPNATPPYDTLVFTHSIRTGTGSAKGVGMRWYELHNPGPKYNIYQQGTYAPDSNYRWMGAVAMDGLGDIALGYSLSTTTAYPAVMYTGRIPSDPLGTMEAEAPVFAGSGNQSDSVRWGDYTSMSVDPADDCTMWYTGQYLAATGSKYWATRLFSFYFPGCQPAPRKTPAATHAASFLNSPHAAGQ